jgi:hypothetical protein
MSLMDAPQYDPTSDNRRRNALIGVAATIVLLAFLSVIEHRVNNFFNALEAKDYTKAYGIWYDDPEWQQHPTRHSEYPLARFTEDWTTFSPVHGPITSHHVDVSVNEGSGTFGTGVIVAVRVNGDHKVFMDINRADKTLSWPAPHEIQYK